MDELLSRLANEQILMRRLAGQIEDAKQRRRDVVRAIFALAQKTGRKPPVTYMAEITGFHVRRIHQIRDGV